MKKSLFALVSLVSCVAAAITSPTIDPVNYAVSATPQSILVTLADGADSRGFAWITDTSVSETKLWVASGAVANFEGVAPITGSYVDKTQNGKTVRCHKAQVSNLAAGTYSYRVGSSTGYVTGTFAVAQKTSTCFLHLSDAQTKYTETFYVWENTVKRATDVVSPENIDMVLFGGDMFDTYKTSISAYNYLKWGAAVDSATMYLPGVAWALSSGNHDLNTSGYNYYSELTGVNYSSPDLCHSFDLGSVHVVVLPFLVGENADNFKGVASWVDADLKAANQAGKTKWNVVMMHWGPYTTGDHGCGSATTRLVELMCPVFSRNHVDLVLQGHDHTFSKTLPYKWDSVGYSTTRNDTAVVNVTPETTTINDASYDLNPEGTYYVSCGCSGPRIGDNNNIYSDKDGASSYEKRTYKISMGTLAVTSNKRNKGDDASWEFSDQAGFGVLRADDETLTYDFYIVPSSGTAAPELYDALKVCKRAAEPPMPPEPPVETKAAQVGDAKYDTFAEAYTAAAAAGDASEPAVIKLLNDVTEQGPYVVAGKFPGQGLVIDLNGHTFSISAAASSDPVDIRKDNKVTIKDGTLTTTQSFRDIIRHYGSAASTLTLDGVTLDGSKLEAGKTTKANCVINIEGCKTAVFTDTTVTAPSGTAANTFYAIKFGNHASATEYSVGTLTLGAGTSVSGDVLINGGTYVEESGATVNGTYYYGKNAHSTWADGVTSDVFAARVGTPLPATGAEDNFCGRLFKSADEAFAAVAAGDELWILRNADFTTLVRPTVDFTLGVLAGATLNWAGTGNYPVLVDGGRTLTLVGNGTIAKRQSKDANSSSFFSMGSGTTEKSATATDGGKIVLDGNLTVIDRGGSNTFCVDCGEFVMNAGTVVNERTDASNGNAVRASNAHATEVTGALVTINAGTLAVSNANAQTLFVKPGKKGTITVAANTETLRFSKPPEVAAPQGYVYSRSADGWYRVCALVWPDPKDASTAGKPIAAFVPTLADTPLAAADAAAFSCWAQGVGNLAIGEAAGARPDCYLLNLANGADDAAIAAAKEEFRLSIGFDAEGHPVVTTLPIGKFYNEFRLLGATTLAGENVWHAKQDGDLFFKAELALPAER